MFGFLLRNEINPSCPVMKYQLSLINSNSDLNHLSVILICSAPIDIEDNLQLYSRTPNVCICFVNSGDETIQVTGLV